MEYRGDSFADMGSVLTKHLRAKYGAAGKECVEVDVADLRKLQTWLYDLADPQFTAVYAKSQDERRKRHDSIETLTVHWAAIQSNVTSGTSRVLRDGLFHEACSRRHPYDSAVLPEYGALTGCQHCHSRLVPFGRDSRLRIHS